MVFSFGLLIIEICIMVDGRVAVYCSCFDVLYPNTFGTLQHLRSYCGFIDKEHNMHDVRCMQYIDEWQSKCLTEDDDGKLNEYGLACLNFGDARDLGDFSLRMLEDKDREFLFKRYFINKTDFEIIQ